jgi:hypothetical protein
MEKLREKFLTNLTDFENEKLRISRKQKTLNYIVVNSQIVEKLKELINGTKNKPSNYGMIIVDENYN